MPAEVKDRDLKAEAHGAGRHKRSACGVRRTVCGVARFEVVRAVKKNAFFVEKPGQKRIVCALRDRGHRHVGRDVGEHPLRAFSLIHADARRNVQNLTRQVGFIHRVGVNHRDAAGAGFRERQKCGGADAAGADHHKVCFRKRSLTCFAPFFQKHLPAVAFSCGICHLLSPLAFSF